MYASRLRLFRPLLLTPSLASRLSLIHCHSRKFFISYPKYFSTIGNNASANTESNAANSSAAAAADSASESASLTGVIWFDNVYPMRAHFLDPRHLFASHQHELLMPQIIAEAEKLEGRKGGKIEILSMTPRIKESGIFVRFRAPVTDSWRSASDVGNSIIQTLIQHPHRAFLTPKPVHAHLVKGEPFMDDLLSRFPSSRLKLELKGPAAALADLTVEDLYSELRQFGRINDLTISPYVKDQPRQASVQFRSMHGAVGVRNCLHRFALTAGSPPQKLTLYVIYDPVLKTSLITGFFMNHPRIMVPLLTALFLLLTILIFDPLRRFNIKNKITKRLNWREIGRFGILQWLMRTWKRVRDSEYLDRIGFGSTRPSSSEGIGSWSARQHDEEKVAKWLHSVPDRILFLTGPKGAGKLALVQKIVKDRRNVIYLDAAHFIDRPDDEFIKGLTQEIGFQPGFTIINAIWNMLDIFTPGASKATSSTQISTQLQKILEVTAQALEEIAASATKSKTVNCESIPPAVKQSLPTFGPIGDSESQTFVASEITRDSEVGRSSIPSNGGAIEDELPLIVIDGFTPDNRDKHGNFLSSLVSWAGEQTFRGHGRFLFLTDAALEESLSKQLADVKMTEVLLNDASVDSAFEFIARTLGKSTNSLAEAEKREIFDAVAVIGGRYNDLVTLARQLESGASPREAKEEILTNAVSQVKGVLFDEPSKSAKWNRVQLWQTMLMIAAAPAGAVWYDDVLFNVFLGDDAALKGLARADLLRIDSLDSGSADQLRAGSPVFLEAFRRMASSVKLRPGLDLQVAKHFIQQEQSKINQYEEELNKISNIESQLYGAAVRNPSETEESIGRRRIFLLKLISEAHEKMDRFDQQRRNCEKQIKQLTPINSRN